MEKLIELVLSASLPDAENPVSKWVKANQITPLEDWPGEVSRLVTCFYANQGGHIEVKNAPLLKGVYKSNWSRNSLNLKAIIGVLENFDRSNIDYRLIKGGAIVLYIGLIGARRMGDLDILVNHKNRSAVSSILFNEGFSPRYLGDRRGRLNEIWENEKGNVIDLHFLRFSDLYNIAFQGYEKKKYLNYDFKLPRVEASILIAIHHGILNHSKGDYAQGLWDISMLYDKSDNVFLERLAIKSGQLGNLLQGIRKLNILGSSLSPLGDSNKFWIHIGLLKFKINSIINHLNPFAFPRIWNGHNTDFPTFRSAILKQREFLYAFWALFGMLRPIERFLTLKFGGLTPKANLKHNDHSELKLFPYPWFSLQLNSTIRSYFQNEIRLQLTTPPGNNSRLDIEIDLENFSPRMLFIDGIGFGHLTPNQGSRYGFELQTPTDCIELSFRDFSKNSLPWSGVMKITWSPGIRI